LTASGTWVVKVSGKWYLMGAEDLTGKLFELLEERGYQIIAPTERRGAVVLSEVREPEEVTLKFTKPVNSPKYFLIPNGECILRWSRRGEDVVLEEPPVDERYAFLCVRPCDANSLVVLDHLLLEEPIDYYYMTRRKQSFVVALSCTAGDEYCFCESLGTNVPLPGSCDLWLVPAQNGFAARAMSGEGEIVLRELRLQETSEPAIPKGVSRAGLSAEALSRLPDLYDDERWAELAKLCLLCGACRSVCPTCTCYEVVDLVDLDLSSGARVRHWYSCIFRQFTRVAGDRITRAGEAERFKHKYYHKFVYSKLRYGLYSCVGCGRCAQYCPVHIDPVEVVGVVGGGS